MNKKVALPDNFFFGGGFAANQAEGGYQEGGRGLSNVDILPYGEERKAALTGENVNLERIEDTYYPSDISIDFYHKYKSDIQLLGKLGINMFKLSISWSRIFPKGEEEEPNQEGLNFYKDVASQLKENNITPLIELSHYDMPLELIKKYGGWKNRKIVDLFEKFVEIMAQTFSDEMYWIPIHEIDAIMHYPFMAGGIIKNDNSNLEQDKLLAVHHQFIAHAKAESIIHKYNPSALVGMMQGNELMIPATSSPEDNLAAVLTSDKKFFFMDVLVRGYYPNYSLKEFERKGLSIPWKEGDAEILKNNTVEFVTFPYYNNFTYCVQMKKGNVEYVRNPNLNPKNSYSDATSLRTMLNVLYDRYQLPIIIGELAIGRKDILSIHPKKDEKAIKNENLYDKKAIGGVDDDERIEFLRDHYRAIHDAINLDGVDCRGALLWEIIDTLSVSKGTISNRLGLIYVDRDDEGNGTLERKPKKSYYWLQEAIAKNEF